MDDRSVDSSYCSGSSASGTDTRQSGETSGLAGRETVLVKRVRCLAYSVLIAVALTASVGVLLYSQNEETTTFEDEFQGHGLKLIASFQEDSFRKLQALASLSSELTRYALSKDMVWPFVTVSQSAFLLEPYLSVGDFAAVQIHPIVPPTLRDVWETYSVQNQGWIEQDLQARGINGTSTTTANNIYSPESAISPYIKNYVGIDTSPGEWIPFWQYAPVIPNRFFVNFNRLAWKGFRQEARTVKEKKATLSPTFIFQPGLDLQSTQDFQFTDQLLRAGGSKSNYESEPLGYIHYPILDHFDDTTSRTVAILSATVYWTGYFSNVLPEGVQGIVCVVENNMGQVFTYQIRGEDATFMGMQDLHETKYDDMELSAVYSSLNSQSSRYTGVPVDEERISYRIRVYPSTSMRDDYTTNRPWLYALAMFFIFVFTASILLLYDRYVEQRQAVVLTTAEKSTAVVASLFPETVRHRVMEESTPATAREDKPKMGFLTSAAVAAKVLTANDPMSPQPGHSSIIADHFPQVTVMFTDIVGFTSWCSAREPVQVFHLLETLYGSFDKTAKRRKIFKVETIGDCYVACAGCPTPRSDHAVAVTQFAKDCLVKMSSIFNRLKSSLGPSTGDLSMRFGIHSGPVTGGVVRGENARFQLFGDTMNMTARMESNGMPGRIHLSKETADLLVAAGKSSWIEPREGMIKAKGKEGLLQTYWLNLSVWNKSLVSSMDMSMTEVSVSGEGRMLEIENEKRTRLIDWNTDVLVGYLKQIAAHNRARGRKKLSTEALKAMELRHLCHRSTIPLEEVSQIIIPLPEGISRPPKRNAADIELDPKVIGQVRSLVENICSLHNSSNPFHNFDHASHVVSFVKKLLSEIVDRRLQDVCDGAFGITFHPITQFAVVFSALIHTVDHQGVPNAQLVSEGSDLAGKYRGLSVSEQHGFDVAYELLLRDDYADLRGTIYGDEAEMTYFRQVVVNSVLATDRSVDRHRWEEAFGSDDLEHTNHHRRATVVLELLIRASDIAHTMQHWHVYRQWNRRLFEEMYLAYKRGRSEQDPSDFWYLVEKESFDFYVIPLAKRLKECRVFGATQYLDYAMKNKEEWEEKGESLVAQMIADSKAKHDLNEDFGRVHDESRFFVQDDETINVGTEYRNQIEV